MLTIILISVLLIVLFVLFWLLLICPSDATPQDYETFANRAYAHRGLHSAEIPENSLAAFAAAAQAGYGIELDVHMSKDGKIVVFHDDDFSRLCADKRRVDQTGYQQMRKLRLSGTEHTIPLLSKVLDTVGARVPLIIEFKHRRDYKPFCDAAIAVLDGYTGAFCVESFDPRILAYLRKRRPKWMRGQLVCRSSGQRLWIENFVFANLLLNLLSKPHFIAYRHEEMHNFNYRLATGVLKGLSAAWTVRSPQDFEKLCGQDVDMIIFEDFEAPRILYDESEGAGTVNEI